MASDGESIMIDAQMDMEEQKYMEERNLIHKSLADEYADEAIFSKHCEEIVDAYNLENYIDKTDDWDKLSEENKLNYCFELLEEDPSDDFPLLRQVDVFTKLVNLDFKEFNYYRVLECAFFDIPYDGVIRTKTYNIKFNPLIPLEHYKKYLSKLQTATNIDKLNIPVDQGTTSYLIESFNIWYLHSVKGLTGYKIEGNPTISPSLKDKQIRRRIDVIKKLIVKNGIQQNTKPKPITTNHDSNRWTF